MKKQLSPIHLTDPEKKLIAALRRKPALGERFENILAITDGAQGLPRTADQVEGLLIDELRRVGNVGLGAWALQVEERVSAELKNQDASVRSRKKKR